MDDWKANFIGIPFHLMYFFVIIISGYCYYYIIKITYKKISISWTLPDK